MAASEPIVIRAMTWGDLAQVVQLHLRCFDRIASDAVALGPEFVSTSYAFFLHDAKSFSFVATAEDAIIGVINGRLGSSYGPGLRRYTLPAAVFAHLRNPRLLMNAELRHKALRIFRRAFIPMSKPKTPSTVVPDGREPGRTVCLGYFAVHPDYRNLRIADLLLARVEEQGRTVGMLYVSAGVRAENTGARFAYKKRGYARSDAPNGGVNFLLRL